MIEPYTTPAEIRAAIGVTDKELSDTTLQLDIYEKNLVMELEAIGDNDGALTAAFATIKDQAEKDRTAPGRRLYDAVLLFAPYVVALQLETSAPLFAPKQITDGKAAISRHSESPFKAAFDTCRQYSERFRQNLESRWAQYNSTSTADAAPPTQFVVSSPSVDPVTG